MRISPSSFVAAGFFAAAAAAQAAGGFTLTSPAVAPGGTLAKAQVFNGFGCSGDNVSPELQWSGAPAGTKSFAVTVYDPDAPTGSGWWHWIAIDLPASTSSLPAGAGGADGKGLPPGARHGRSDFGGPGFGGACPPQGDKPHRYVFTVYALKVDKLDVPADATAALIGYMINANKIAKASFTAKYGR